MSKQTVQFSSKNYKQTAGCQEVAICLADVDNSANGSGIVFGTVENSGRFLTDTPNIPVQNPRGDQLYQYTLTIDNSELAAEVVLACGDISDFSVEACFWHKFVDSL